MPPTEPGPGMFPATAAACAAAAAWAVAACCCICLWHWRKSNTWQGTRQMLRNWWQDMKLDWTLNTYIVRLKLTWQGSYQDVYMVKSPLNNTLFLWMTTVLQSHLNVSTGVDLVNCVSRGTSSLSIQVITLHKHCMITQTAHPDISFTFTLQLDAFANVEPEDGKMYHLSYLETYIKCEVIKWTIW